MDQLRKPVNRSRKIRKRRKIRKIRKVKNQRNYIGIESSKEYYDLSLKRLKNIGVKIT